jgi:uncharacterized membrane protein
MENQKLDLIKTITDGVTISLKNFPSLVVAAILYVFTLWIPYINVGTTIAMQTIPGRLAKGDIISPLFIFESKYRDDFSAFFLLCAFMSMSILIGCVFMWIPGIVISISLSLATIILVDDQVSPTDAMKLSNKATKGNKMMIFLTNLVFGVAFIIGYFIVVGIASIFDSGAFAAILILAYTALAVPFSLGITSVYYRELYLKRK